MDHKMNVVLNKRAISPENKIKTNCTPLKSEKKKFKPKLGGFSESQLLKRTLADYLSIDNWHKSWLYGCLRGTPLRRFLFFITLSFIPIKLIIN
jgi:hypothetical protein